MGLLSFLSRDRRRQIFKYWDGAAWRRVDPAIIRKRMREHPKFVLEKHGKLLRQQDQFGQEAYDITLAAMYEIFEVRPVDDHGGLTETEVMWLLTSYLTFCGALKKNISFRPTLPPITESTPSDDDSATRSSSPSTSSESEPQPAGQM